MRVVIDTNVLISAIFFGGLPAEIFPLIDDREIIPCFTPATFEELKRILLLEKFSKLKKYSPIAPEEFLEKLKDMGLFFIQSIEPPKIIKKDPSDNHFLLCVLLSGAKFIISGDEHLLKLKEFKGIPILKPKEFINRVKK